MAIDRVGKGGGLPPTPEAQGTGAGAGASKTGAKFEVDRAEPADKASATTVEAAGATTPLSRLRAGEVDVHGYIDLKVDEATSALHGLSPSALADIKSALRDQMRTDPGVADLVRTATGKMPTPPED